MPTGPVAFLGMQGVSGRRPCVWTHLKKAVCCFRLFGDLVLFSPVCWQITLNTKAALTTAYYLFTVIYNFYSSLELRVCLISEDLTIVKFEKWLFLLLLLILVGAYTIFHSPIFHSICILFNVYNFLLYHAFFYILSVVGLSNQTLSGQLIQFFVRTIYVSGWSVFYNVLLIVAGR